MSDRLFDFILQSVAADRDFAELDRELDHRFGETCATLVMDSSGFTRATRVLGPAFFLGIICQVRKVCFETARRFHAAGSRAWADNFYAEFQTVDEAVGAALAVHRHFADHPLTLLSDQDRFGVCIGIGYGRVLRSDHEGVYGSEMNSASKLGEDIAECGQTLLTEAAYGALSRSEDFQVTRLSQAISGVDLVIYSIRPRG